MHPGTSVHLVLQLMLKIQRPLVSITSLGALLALAELYHTVTADCADALRSYCLGNALFAHESPKPSQC